MKQGLLFLIFVCYFGIAKGQLSVSYTADGDTNATVIYACKGIRVQFRNLNPNNQISSRQWTFPGGTPPSRTTKNANVRWNNNGTYNCWIAIVDTAGNVDTAFFQVIVDDTKPSASFGTINDVCLGRDNLLLTQGTPSGGEYYGTAVSGDYFYPGIADTGYHSIGYIYTAPNGCSDTAFSTIYVKPGPLALLTELNSFSNCNGFSFANPDFTVFLNSVATSFDSITNHKIIWGDGSPDWDSSHFRPNLNHTYLGQGIFRLTYIVTSINGCADTTDYNVVNTTNPASLNLNNPGGTNGCAPVTITFPVSTTNTDTTTTYNIDWGDGTDTSFNHPPPAFISHTYDTTSCIEPQGYFEIEATSTNFCITTTSVIQGPFVTQPAIAEFVPNPGCVNKPHSLQNNSVPGFDNACSRLTTFIWDWGDGSAPDTIVSNAPIPPPGIHTWTSPGTYNVQLIVDSPPGSNCQGDTVVYPVCIQNPPSTSVTFQDTIDCAPFPVSINNQTDTIGSCELLTYYWSVDTAAGWNLAQGSSLLDYEPTIIFTEPGTYALNFHYNSVCGSDSITQFIYVQDASEVYLDTNVLAIYCDTTTINTQNNLQHQPLYIPNGTPITSYLWRITPTPIFINGTDSTSQYPIIQYPPGNYTVQLIINNKCGADTATQSFVVNPSTNAGFNINSNAGCHPFLANLTSTSQPGAQHEWYIDTNFYSSNRDTTVLLTNTGVVDSTYLIRLVVSSGIGCVDTIDQTVTVRPTPVANFNVIDVCLGDTTFFTDSSYSNTGRIAEWLWDFGDGQIDSNQNPGHLYANPGQYLTTLTVIDSNGCSNSYQDSLWVRSYPIANFSFLHSAIPDSACILDTVFFLDASVIDTNGTAIVQWQWDVFDNGTINDTSQNSYWVFNIPGSFPVRLTVTSEQGCVDTYVDTIHVSNPSVPFFTLSTYGGCTPVTVVATNQSSGYILNYDWVFYTLDSNNNRVIEYTSSLNDPNPVPPFQANVLSNKTVFVELTASNGCYSASYTDTINIKPIPIPFFAFSSDTGCSPLTVSIQVDGLATGNPDSILFDFGDGTPGLTLFPNINILPNGDTLFTWNQQSHTFVYNGLGLDTTYFVTLFASNECGDSSYTVPINVRNRSVQSFFNANQNIGCAPLNVTFNDFSFAALSVSYCFDFDTVTKSCNGNLFFGRNPSQVFNTPGNYVVAQFALNDCGADTSYQVIEVRPKPNIQFSFPSPVCSEDSIYFINNTSVSSGNIIGYKWYFGDGDSSTFTNPVHAYDSAGTYSICITVFTDAGCDSTYCQDIVVNGRPTADFSFQNNVCQNLQPIQFINSSTNGTGNIISYEWFFGDGNVATQINPQHIYQSPGTYDVKLIVTNDNNCQDSLIQQITIYPVPVADFSYIYANGDSCGVPNQIDFTNASNGAGGYYWDFNFNGNPGQDTSITMHPTFTYTQPGSYRVMLISRNGLGCQDTAFRTVNIHPIPEPDFMPNTTAGCAPLEVFFNNTTKLPPGFTDSIYYTWYFGDGTSSSQASTEHRFVNPGTYNVKLVARTENRCEDSVRYDGLITVYPVPEPQFVYALQSFGVYRYTNFNTGGTPPYTYSWDFGDGNTSTEMNPTHEFDVDKSGWENGFNVCLTVIDDNGCDSTWCDTVKIGAYTLYVPNAMAPDSDGEEALFLPKGQGLESYTCRIFDRWGNLLWETSELDPITAEPVEAWDGTFKGQPVPAGVYIWRIDATFANGLVWRGEGIEENVNSNSGTITILR